MTLRTRLTAAFVLVVLVPLLVVVGLVATVLPAAVFDRQEQALRREGRLAAQVLEQVCSRARAGAEAAGRATGDGLAAALRGLVANDVVDGVRVLDAAGRTLALAGTAPAVPGGGDCRSGVVLQAGGRPHIAAAVRLQRASGDVGWAVAGIVIDDDLAAALHPVGTEGAVVLLDGTRQVARSGDAPPAALVRDALQSPGEPVRDAAAAALLVPARDSLPVAVLLVQPAGQVSRAVSYALALLVGAVALAAGIAILLARATARPLEELGEAAARVAAGDLSTTIEVRSRDEIGRLAGTFNTMTGELRSYVGALQSSRDELQAGIARLGATLAGTHDLNRILSVVLDAAMAATRARAGAVLLLSPDRTTLELAVGQGLVDDGPLQLATGQGVAGQVAVTGRPLHGRTGSGQLLPAPGEPTGTTVVAVPLSSSTNVIGVLLLLDREDGEEFDERDLATLGTFTSQATVAVDNVLLHEETSRLSVTDGLTGLWNYRYLQLSLAKEVERATRFERPLSLLMLDLDHFKLVNDVHGHQRGDAVLVELAERIRGLVRDVDTLARYGGEEFVLVLPETDETGAVQAAERIRQAVRALPFGNAGDPPVVLTLSIGVAVFPVHGAGTVELLRAADDALYVAKREGRDAWRLAGLPGVAPAP